MSLVSYTVRCDWPRCDAEVTVHDRTMAAVSDRNWKVLGLQHPALCAHLCPKHRFKTWIDLDNARDQQAEKEMECRPQ